MLRIFPNPHRGTPGLVVLNAAGYRRARAEITSWIGYAPTPLIAVPDIAGRAGVASVHVKDESPRFGLGSFKALGGAYAVQNVVAAARARHGDAAPVTVCCATDGNHGRSVAWGARRAGAACRIFVHEGVSQGRIDAIAAYGATIAVVPGTYDDSVRAAAAAAEANGWHVVSDTSYPGYTEIPREVMQGYRLMAEEALDAMPEPPTHVFIQAGVGGVAAAVSAQLRAAGIDAALIVVEPDRAACLLASAEAGTPTAVGGALDTIMAGLACGEPSMIAWQELDRAAAAFVAIPDEAAIDAMRLFGAAGIVSGESGAAGLAALLLAGPALGLDAGSRVLLFSTEGATDPALYAELLGA